ncbi:unnamed protein product [Closterium sp. Naga37s-1]|nr:unnamed protein product [Closterium sp. Naga37s-1]
MLQRITRNFAAEGIRRSRRSFGQLGRLHELRLHACYGLELPAFFANLSSLKTLAIYGGTSLISLPPNFEQLPQLRCLELFNCAMPSLPERFGQLPKLEALMVGSRESYTRDGADQGQPSSSACPAALSAARLNEPLMGRCLLRSLPPSVSSLTGLQQLVMDGCDALESLPEGLGRLAGLQVLHVKNCAQLSCFPSLLPAPPPTTSTSAPGGRSSAAAPAASAAPAAPAASAAAGPAPHSRTRPLARPAACSTPLPMLHSLEISNCPTLTSLPRGLDALPRLEQFTLEKCDQLEFADDFLECPSSTSLAAPIALPPSVTSVSLLDVFPEACYLPDSFLTLSRLTHLSLHELVSLDALFAPAATGLGMPGTRTHPLLGFSLDPRPGQPARLALLSSLQHLAIVESTLPSLPSNLNDLSSLKVLILEKCRYMPSLPASLPHLSNLEKLVLKTLPRLARLPKNLGQLKALKELTVESCDALVGLPASMGLLSSLVPLSVTDCNKFASLPTSIGSLPRLASLKLNCLPRLRRLPDTLSLLPALMILSLEDYEQLQALPEGLAGVGRLREVNVAGCCKLKHVPQSLLARQHVIDLQGLR